GKLSSKEELKQESAKLATKEELKQETAKLATKEELKQEIAKLATKEELKQEVAKLATKEELRQATSKLATREAVEVLANQVLKNTIDIDEIKTELKSINHKVYLMQDKIDRLDEKLDYKFNMVLNAVDNVLKEITNNRTEKAAYGHTLTRHEGRLENHEKRINILEREAI
ncbi:DUF1664 domain-containing protein, partial [candidate division KSB1 bacterium]|nr:DUF1664 domain-containing protein [candidate division KSB1 bacterium]